MARLKNGFLGNASGKLGNVVFAKWRDLFTARSYQPDISDAKTTSQRTQRDRMLALLQFLRPINQPFIRMLNENICPESTPWAKAIKDNMPAMTQECCFSLDKLRLGNPKFPAVQIKTLSYDPFIDQIRLEYSFFSHPAAAQQFPFMVATALGKYKTIEERHEFDIRHPARYFPAGKFYSDIINLEAISDVLSFWMHGWFWLSAMNNETPDQTFNINSNLSEPLSFIPKPIIEPFNNDIPEDLIPVQALIWEYENTGDMWRLTFEMERELYDPEAFVDCTLVFWILALTNQTHSISDPVLWQLNETRYVYNVNEQNRGGGAVMLYYILNKENQQISKFNRLYINLSFEGTNFHFFEQLFKCNYTHPASFVLKSEECGCCGSFDELFSDFITYWTQPDHPKPTDEFPLNSQTYEIDEQYFKCEITSGDGTPIKEAQKNDANMFYCNNLIPGRDYSLIFTYDDILLDVIDFNCPDASKVVYLSPAHIISNKTVLKNSDTFNVLVRKLKKRQEYFQIPQSNWSSRTLEMFLSTNPPDKADYLCPNKPKRYRAGADLAGKIK